jgi:hypothetical protein
MLMDEAVAPLGGRPLFVKRDLMLTQVVVDVETPSHGSYHIIFAGSSDGDIYKIVQWAETTDGGTQQSRLLACQSHADSQGQSLSVFLIDHTSYFRTSSCTLVKTWPCHS